MSRTGTRPLGGFVLIEILIVIAIIALLIVGYYGLSGRGGDEEEQLSTPGAAMERARVVECASNLNQLRMLVEMHVAEHGEYPATFTAGDHGTLGRCPVSNQAYQYEPQTGRIWCVTPGHENL